MILGYRKTLVSVPATSYIFSYQEKYLFELSTYLLLATSYGFIQSAQPITLPLFISINGYRLELTVDKVKTLLTQAAYIIPFSIRFYIPPLYTPAIWSSTYFFVLASWSYVGFNKLVIFYEFKLTEPVGKAILFNVVVNAKYLPSLCVLV